METFQFSKKKSIFLFTGFPDIRLQTWHSRKLFWLLLFLFLFFVFCFYSSRMRAMQFPTYNSSKLLSNRNEFLQPCWRVNIVLRDTFWATTDQGFRALGGLKHETFSEIFPMLFQAEFYISRFFTKKCMHSPNGQTDFDKWYLVRNRMTRATRYQRETWDQLRTLTLKRSNVRSSAMSSELWPQISRKGYKIERWSQQRANIKLHVVYRNTLLILTYSVSERSKVMTLNLEVE